MSEANDARPPLGGGATLVSGATGALGAVIAARLTDAGARLVLPVRSGFEAAARRWPQAQVIEANLLDANDARRVVEAAVDAHGGLSAVVNVAGGFGMRSALELESSDLERQLDMNLRTAVNLTGASLPALVDAGAGTVIGVSAGAARRGGRGMAAYAASKAALEAYLASVRAEVGPQGVGVSVLIPEGTIDTPGNRAAMPDADRSTWIDPEALADAVQFLLTRGDRGRVDELRVHA